MDTSRRSRAYQWAILAGHAVVAVYFLGTNALSDLSSGGETICWPYLQNYRIAVD
jgi:hypothetical protein